MPEVHTCTCGGQTWIIMGAKICCNSCGKEYNLMWLDDEMESPKEFNERIKQEEHGGLVAMSKPPFTKKLISEEGPSKKPKMRDPIFKMR